MQGLDGESLRLLEASAKSTTSKRERCRAFFYLGALLEIRGDRAGAAESFDESARTEIRTIPQAACVRRASR